MIEEDADAIVVGARCAGSATAIALARAGRRVVAIDRVRFPADTISTHLLFAGGVAELAAVGALERVEALGAPRMPLALMTGAGITVRGTYTPVSGIDYGLCVRRPGLDAVLAQTAREAGAEVREGTRAIGLLTTGQRVRGVRVKDPEGNERQLRAPLVVGADGRASLVARQVGAERPHRSNANQRACFYSYWEDAGNDLERRVASQWREGEELGTAFPCDGGQLLVLLMPPLKRCAEFRADLEGSYERTIDQIPGLRLRLRGCTKVAKVRAATDLPSYFRRSSGPGWALAGDAGHFKDPVTAQGIRDAVRFGRLLGEAVAPVLDKPSDLDRALRSWERRRDRECLESYQWTNQLARAEEMSLLEIELYRAAAASPALAREFLDVFSRVRQPHEVLTLRRSLRLVLRALGRSGADRSTVLRTCERELRLEMVARSRRVWLALRRG